MRLFAQFFATFLAAVVIAKTWSDYRLQRESYQMVIFWTIIWFLVIVISFFPNFVDLKIFQIGGKGSGVGTLLGMGEIFLLFILYRIYVKMERVERELTKLIKNLALKDLKK